MCSESRVVAVVCSACWITASTGQARGLESGRIAAKAAKRAADLLPLILPMKDEGASLRQIAEGLNRCGVPAPRGGTWSAVAVKRILDRQVRQTTASA
jgi:hypothetical protein